MPITLTRRKRDEAITPFRLDRVDHLVVLARKLARWTTDNAVAIAATEPEMPAGIYNRAADNWRPLLAIATVAGGDWLARGQKAALASVAADIDDAALLELLLGDIRDDLRQAAATRLSRRPDPVGRTGRGARRDGRTTVGRVWAKREADHAEQAGPAAEAAEAIVPRSIRPTRSGAQGLLPRPASRRPSHAIWPQRGLPNRNTATTPMKWALLSISKAQQPKPMLRFENARNPITTGLVAVLRLQKGVSGEEHEVCDSLRPSRRQRSLLQRRADGPAAPRMRGAVSALPR